MPPKACSFGDIDEGGAHPVAMFVQSHWECIATLAERSVQLSKPVTLHHGFVVIHTAGFPNRLNAAISFHERISLIFFPLPQMVQGAQ
jgi:hypothetical protein